MVDWLIALGFGKRLGIAIVLFVLTAVTAKIGTHYNAPMKLSRRYRHVMPLEITPSVREARNIVGDWKLIKLEDGTVLGSAIKGVWADFPFIVCYVVWLAFLCLWAGIALSKSDPRWLDYGIAFAWAIAIAGALDFFVENPPMPFFEMRERFVPAITITKAIGSWIKWFLAALTSIFLIVSLTAWCRMHFMHVPDREAPPARAPQSTTAHP